MEFTPFRIVVFAITTFFIIAAVSYLFVFSPSGVVPLLSDDLKLAEAQEGMLVENFLNFSSGSMLNAKTFDSESRTAVIKCISPELCTPDRVTSDLRMVSFRKGTGMEAYSRCIYEINLYRCVIYLGSRPAQLRISEAAITENGKAVRVKVENTGGADAEDAGVRAVVYRIAVSGEREEELYYTEAEPWLIPLLHAGEEASSVIGLGTAEGGLYIVRIKAEAEEAGFDREEVRFRAEGREEGCTVPEKTELLNSVSPELAETEQAADPETGLCS
jgi:hypothetical protein